MLADILEISRDVIEDRAVLYCGRCCQQQSIAKKKTPSVNNVRDVSVLIKVIDKIERNTNEWSQEWVVPGGTPQHY